MSFLNIVYSDVFYYSYPDLIVQSSLPLHPLVKHPWLGYVWLCLVYTVVKLFFRLCCQVRIEGSEHIPSQGGVVLASNHISGFDTVLLPYTVLATQGLQIIWSPAKAELFRSRLGGCLLTALGVFPVRRGQHDRLAMRQMIAGMRTHKMMLFPEGTRSRDGRLQEGKRTVGKLIYAARPVVIPAAIVGTAHIIPHLKSLVRGRAPVSVHYGKPVELQHYYALPDTKETAIAIVQEVMRAIAALLYNASQALETGPVQPGSARVPGTRNGSSTV
jgi:1-acyl-sn-glycerol-3-phosphate acyltransferase